MKVKKAVIPTAGLGTRFLPVTKAMPKSMLPIIDTPTIDYIIDEIIESGIEEVIIITSHNTSVIENHFAENKALEERLLIDGKKDLYDIAVKTHTRIKTTFVKQTVLNGLAGALLCAEEYLNGEPFALLLGDEIIYTEKGKTPCIKQLINAYEKSGKTVLATMRVADQDVNKYGNLGVAKDGVVKEVYALKEKPQVNEKLSNYAVIGRYVVAEGVMPLLKNLKPKGSEIIFTDALDVLASNGNLVATEFDGIRYDVGDKLGYVQATVEYALRNEKLGKSVAEFIKQKV